LCRILGTANSAKGLLRALIKMLKAVLRNFSTLKLLEERAFFNVSKLPKRVNKREALANPQSTAIPLSPSMKPYVLERPVQVDKTYHWCSCGLSKKQPFCDSSHKGTSFGPLSFTVEDKVERIHLCLCKLTTNPPFCDGHKCTEVDLNKA
jgi:CDGSH-type Zn-finger protein